MRRKIQSILQIVEQALGVHALEADLINFGEEWVALFTSSSLQEPKSFLGGDHSLELLTVKQFMLELGEGLSTLNERFGAFTVTTSKGS